MFTESESLAGLTSDQSVHRYRANLPVVKFGLSKRPSFRNVARLVCGNKNLLDEHAVEEV